MTATATPRVCLVEPDDGAARELSELLAQVGHYEVEHVTSLADLLRVADRCDVVITSLDLPDAGSGAQAIDALCSALSDSTAPGVVVIVPDLYSEVYPYLWSRARDCIQAVLSAADLRPDQLARGINEAINQRRRHGEHPPRGQILRGLTYSPGGSAVTNSKLDQILDKLDRLQLEQTAQSGRLRKLEEGYAASDQAAELMGRGLRNIYRRVKKIEETLSGETSNSRRPLAVRVDDLEASRSEHRVWLQTASAQALPVVFGALVVLILSYVTAYVQREINATPPAVPAVNRP